MSQNTKLTNSRLEKEIYKAFSRCKSKDVKISDILSEIDFSSSFNPRFEFSVTSMIKSLILMRLKGIQSQTKLAAYLKTHEKDSINIGFFRDENNKVKTPNQRTLSYFIKNHLDEEKKQIIEFMASRIEKIADKFNII